MADMTPVYNAVTSLVVGGLTAASAVGATIRDLRKRLGALEEKVGSPGTSDESKTGLFALTSILNEELNKIKRSLEGWDEIRRFKREVDSWQDTPPDWAVRLVRSKASSASMNLEIFQELEGRVEARYKGLADRIRHTEEALEEHEKRSRIIGAYVSKTEYEEDSKHRGDEMSKIRENLSIANGFLRGVMATLGYLDDEPPTSPGIIRRK